VLGRAFTVEALSSLTELYGVRAPRCRGIPDADDADARIGGRREEAALGRNQRTKRERALRIKIWAQVRECDLRRGDRILNDRMIAQEPNRTSVRPSFNIHGVLQYLPRWQLSRDASLLQPRRPLSDRLGNGIGLLGE